MLKNLEEILIKIDEGKALIAGLAKRTGKSPSEVESMWDEIKTMLKKKGSSEEDPSFYGTLVKILKRKLHLGDAPLKPVTNEEAKCKCASCGKDFPKGDLTEGSDGKQRCKKCHKF